MIVTASQVVTRTFTTQNSTGAAANADSLPTAVLVKNGTDTAQSVTITNVATGRYKAVATIPSDAADYDNFEFVVSATVGGTAAKGVVVAGTVADASLVNTPIYGEVVPRTFTFTHTAYLNEIADNTIRAVTTADGPIEGVPLNGIASMSLKIVDAAGTTVQYVANASLDRTNDATGYVGWTNNSAMTSSERSLRAYLFDDDGDVVLMTGTILVKYAPANAA